MAGFAVENSGTDKYSAKLTWFVIVSSMMASMGGLIFGYDIGISGSFTSN